MTDNSTTFIENHGLPKSTFNKSLFKEDLKLYDKATLLKSLSDDVIVLNTKQVKAFVEDINKKTSKLEKAEAESLYNKATEELLSLKLVRVSSEVGEENLFIRKKSTPVEELSKSLDTDLEKGAISEAFRYSSKIHLMKTGVQIKDKAEILKKEEESKANHLQSKLDEMLEETDCVPTESISEYQYRGFKKKIGQISYKRYMWNKTYYSQDVVDNGAKFMTETKSSDIGNTNASSQEEADICRKYNDTLEQYIETKVEIANLDFIASNLDDKKKYELSQEQAVSLGF
jgi:hypothetical protein